DFPKAYRRLLDMEAVTEGVVLSTCNRVEVFAEVASYHSGFLDMKRFLAESREIPPDEFAEPLYAHYEDDAALHLFSVAAGLDSMVLGEPQSLAQVRQAYRVARGEHAAGPSLSGFFRSAIRTGRRVRAETAIGASPAAMVEAGASLAERELGGLAGRSVLVVGAGGMAALAVKDLRARGVGTLRILNRSFERASRLASRAGAEAGGLGGLAAKLAPLIQSWRARGARIQAAELARVAPRLSRLSDREWAAVQALASGIVAKLLHEPIVRLKDQPGPGPDSLARALAELFG